MGERKGPRMERKRVVAWLRREDGYNLIEVLIAVSLLATALVAIVSLFVLGGRYVKSGKELSKATALGMDVMEDFRNMNFSQVFRVVNGGCASVEKTRTWRSHRATGTSGDYGVPDPATDWQARNIPDSGWTWKSENDSGKDSYAAVLTGWFNQTDQQFPAGLKGSTWITVDGFKNADAAKNWASGDTGFCDANFLRVRVRVEWTEGKRRRDVVFETLKF
jgi:type II secretory pathway pseudopilin PulG